MDYELISITLFRAGPNFKSFDVLLACLSLMKFLSISLGVVDGGIIIRIKIIVATHKKFPMPADRELYLPVLVGAVRNYREGIDYQRDDDGDNISNKNPYYNELTAMYWAWKNLKNADVIGLVHYRRYFCNKNSFFKNGILNKKNILVALKNNNVILPKKRNYYIESNYSHYVHAHNAEPLDITREVIKKFFPEYLKSFDRVMKRRQAHMFNMFLMKKDNFDSYCRWLFSVLQSTNSLVDSSDYSAQEARFPGYLAELLMDVWIEKNEIDYKEYPWKQLGKTHFFKKVCFFMYRKFSGKRTQTHF